MTVTTQKRLARVANEDEDYARLGLKRGVIEPWEDGMRTSGGRGSFEWWYFDSHLDDGTSLVITFANQVHVPPQRTGGAADNG